MATRFVNVDRVTPLLLSPSLQEWLPEDHLARFVVELVEEISPVGFNVNPWGSGSDQFPPLMMSSLLIYSYITGRFSSRKIERATYDDVAVRYVTGDTHPDHDTICKFRRENGAAFSELFVQVLETAQMMNVLKRFGTVSVDGTKVLANASKHKAVSYARAGEMVERLEQDVAELIAKAENADSTPLEDGLTIPEEIARRERRIEKLKAARHQMELRAKERAETDLAKRVEDHEQRKDRGERGGRKPRIGKTDPDDKAQYNFTDPESRIMKAGNGKHFEQAYNAQSAVDIESRLIVSQSVTDQANDKQQLVPVVAGIKVPYTAETVLADSGYFSEEAIESIETDETGESTGTKVLVAVGRKSHQRPIVELEKQDVSKAAAAATDTTARTRMEERLKQPENRKQYALRKQTVEPVFGIIKEAMGFRRFSMRGKRKAQDEWSLVTCAYNIKRLFHIGVSFAPNPSLKPANA